MLLKATRTGVLTVAALDLLYGQEEGCCPHCCGMCWVLQDMHKRGDLDKVVEGAPLDFFEDSGWWIAKERTVNRAWLTGQWIKLNCNHGVPAEGEEADGSNVPAETLS